MSATTIKEFLVGVGFKVDQSSFSNFKNGISKATASLVGLNLATNLSVAGIYKLVKASAEEIEVVSKLAKKINSSTKDVMELGYAASLSGSSVEAMNSSLENLNRVGGEAALGVGRGAILFKKLGINAKDANGKLKSTTQLMSDVTNKIKGLGSGEKNAVLSKLGIDPSLATTLTSDISELRTEFSQLYDSVGIKSEEAAQGATEFLDSITRIKTVFGLLKKSIAIEFFKPMKESIDALRKNVIINMPKIKQSFVSGFKAIFSASKAFFQVGKGVVKMFSTLHASTNGWSTGILAAAAGWRILSKTILSTPLGRVLALGAAIGLLVEDLMVFNKGGNTAINWEKPKLFFEWLQQTGPAKSLGALVAVFKELGESIYNAFSGNGMLAINSFIDAIAALASGILHLIETITGPLKGAFQVIQNIASGTKNIVKNIADFSPSKFGEEIGSSLSGIFRKQKEILEYNERSSGFGTKYAPDITRNKTATVVNQENNFTINGASSPSSAGQAVLGQMSRVNGDLARNFSSPIQ